MVDQSTSQTQPQNTLTDAYSSAIRTAIDKAPTDWHKQQLAVFEPMAAKNAAVQSSMSFEDAVRAASDNAPSPGAQRLLLALLTHAQGTANQVPSA